jgi:hypothetical protein
VCACVGRADNSPDFVVRTGGLDPSGPGAGKAVGAPRRLSPPLAVEEPLPFPQVVGTASKPSTLGIYTGAERRAGVPVATVGMGDGSLSCAARVVTVVGFAGRPHTRVRSLLCAHIRIKLGTRIPLVGGGRCFQV